MADTRTLDQVPLLSAVSPDARMLVAEPGGVQGAVALKTLLGRLISTDEAAATFADLSVMLGYSADSIALVYADPDILKNGWYRKTGGVGQGGWDQFETLSKATRESVLTLSGNGPPAPDLGVVGQFYRDISVSAEYGPKTNAGWGNGRSLLGKTGAAANVFRSLDALKDIDPEQFPFAVLMSESAGVVFTYQFKTGDYRGKANDLDVVALKNVPLADGAMMWVGGESLRFEPLGGGAAGNAADKLRQRVTVSDYGNNSDAIEKAISQNVGVVEVDIDVIVTRDVPLRSDLELRFTGGRFIVAPNAVITNAVLGNIGGRNITLIRPQIDASAKALGACGIYCIDVTNLRIDGGKLTRANLQLGSFDNSKNLANSVSDLTINLAGAQMTAVYISGINGVSMRGGEILGGLEGVGIYNGARSITLSAISSSGHTRDGFVIINGQEITHVTCFAFSNGQSGFTTQRQTSPQNARISTWKGCQAWDNRADGFDIRGANDIPWGLDTLFVLSACLARLNGAQNGGCGFFIVAAEGVTLDACVAELNRLQGLFIHSSDRTIVNGFRAISNGSDVATGTNRAGILIYNSNDVQINAPTSTNANSEQQDVGIAFTGSSAGGRVVGGNLGNNRMAPFVSGANAIIGAKADTLAGLGVFFKSVSERGIYEEEGYGKPTHLRPRGSHFKRIDGGNPEDYASNDNGQWPQFNVA